MTALLERLYPNIDLRIILPFLLLIVVTAIIAVFIVTSLTANTIQERLDNQLRDSAQIAEDSLTQLEGEYLAALRLMAFTEGVDEAIIGSDFERLETTLRGIIANEQLDDVVVFNILAEPVIRISRSSFPPPNYDADVNLPSRLDWETVQNVLAGVADNQGDKFVDIISYDDFSVVYFVAPVRNEQNEIVGGIAAGISELNLLRLLTNQALAEVALYFDDSQLLISSFVDETAFINQTTPAVQTLLAQAPNTESPIEEITVNDVPYQILFTDWDLRGARVGGMAVALPVDFISGRLNDTRNSFIALFTILVIVIMITGYLIGQSIVRPVFRMVNTTRAIRDGDLSRRVGLRLPDELGELSSSFDHMTDQLVQRNEEISGLYQEQLRETARRTTILESIRDLVIVLDTNAKITLVNDTARAFIQRLSNLNDREPYRKLWDICRNPQRYSTPVTMQLLDLDVSVQATFIKQEDDNVIGYVVVLRDITSVLEAERLKDEMILQLSHELRTPLAGARGYLELAGMMTGEKQQSYLTRSLNQVDVLGEMVNRVIEVSVMLSGQMRLNIATFNLNTQLQSIIEAHRDAIAERNIDLQVQLPDAPTMIDGDEEQLQKAIGNVVENAYRYNFTDGWLLVELELTDEQYVTVLIKDSGRGIDEDEQEKVFERMYRGRSADADETDQRGLGLGLFIAREIVKAHHGRIALRSQIGKGTVVAIRLPIRQPEA